WSRRGKPLDSLTLISATLPSGMISSSSTTVPSSPRRRDSDGYAGAGLLRCRASIRGGSTGAPRVSLLSAMGVDGACGGGGACSCTGGGGAVMAFSDGGSGAGGGGSGFGFGLGCGFGFGLGFGLGCTTGSGSGGVT